MEMGGRRREEEREREKTRPKRQSPGARDTLTTGRVLIAVAAASSFLETTAAASRGKDFRKHTKVYLEKNARRVSVRDPATHRDRRRRKIDDVGELFPSIERYIFFFAFISRAHGDTMNKRNSK